MRTNLSIVLGILATIVIGLQIGIQVGYAAELTASSYTDGYSRGGRDPARDLQGLNSHGYDSYALQNILQYFAAHTYEDIMIHDMDTPVHIYYYQGISGVDLHTSCYDFLPTLRRTLVLHYHCILYQ